MARGSTRYSLALAALILIAGCNAEIDLEIRNEAASAITINVQSHYVVLHPAQSQELRVIAAASEFTIEFEGTVRTYAISLESLPGQYYRTGIRHGVRLLFTPDLEVVILKSRDANSIEGALRIEPV